MYRSAGSLSKMTHQMCLDQLFRQRIKISKTTVEVKQVKLNSKVGVRKVGGLHSIGGVRNPLPTMSHKELFLIKSVKASEGVQF